MRIKLGLAQWLPHHPGVHRAAALAALAGFYSGGMIPGSFYGGSFGVCFSSFGSGIGFTAGGAEGISGSGSCCGSGSGGGATSAYLGPGGIPGCDAVAICAGASLTTMAAGGGALVRGALVSAQVRSAP